MRLAPPNREPSRRRLRRPSKIPEEKEKEEEEIVVTTTTPPKLLSLCERACLRMEERGIERRPREKTMAAN